MSGDAESTFFLDEAPPSTDASSGEGALKVRYEDLGPLGEGGMGEVRRVRDNKLERVVAMKLLRSDLARWPGAVRRFLAEARTTAQLQHPGIVPLLDAGRAKDGRLFYTMPEVRGDTLATRLAAARDAPDVRSLVEILRRVCDAVGYAHARGVVHRDLKPANIMLGPFGEVLVLDWGIARVLAEEATDEPVTPRAGPGTRAGTVTGTPGFMAPEQARGEIDAIAPPTDVYALGVILDHILRILPHHEADLASTARQARAQAPADRQRDASHLAAALGAWLSGHAQRERARALVREAYDKAAESRERFTRARAVLTSARERLQAIPTWASVEDKLLVWKLEATGQREMRRAEDAATAAMQRAQAALSHAPELPEAHGFLVQGYAKRVGDARATREPTAALIEALRYHAERLPPDDPLHAEVGPVLDGSATLSLDTEPVGVRVVAHRQHEVPGRQLVTAESVDLGETPLVGRELAVGSWVLELRHPAGTVCFLPVNLDPGEAFDGSRLDGTPAVVPVPDALGPDECFVPPGRFRAGDEGVLGAGWRLWNLWAEGFVMKRDPVTNGEYVAFLDDLVATGCGEEAAAYKPWGDGVTLGSDGRHHLGPDEDGDDWGADHPVTRVDLLAARAYARWYAARTGLPWRLPGTLEYEKAARGADGRLFPWGNLGDGAFSVLRTSGPRPTTVSVHEPTRDVSPFGVRWLGGHVEEWCDGLGRVDCNTRSMLTRWEARGGLEQARSNSFGSNVRPLSQKRSRTRTEAVDGLGFRVVRSWPEP